tara:strand:+ start:959 stop:1186 length:228 start_codon:yes stop_codon:yes gene_type:complete
MLRNFEIDAVETDGDDQLRFRNWSDWDGAIELMHKTEDGAVNYIVLDKEQLEELEQSARNINEQIKQLKKTMEEK